MGSIVIALYRPLVSPSACLNISRDGLIVFHRFWTKLGVSKLKKVAGYEL